MTKLILNNTKNCPLPGGHYSHSCTVGHLIFISGQLPITKDGLKLNNTSFEEQTKLVLLNLDESLIGAGTTRERLVQVRVYITHMHQWPTFNDLYSAWIGNHRPTRAVASVSELHYGSAIEIEAVAAV
ncbi:RidA family protein [Acinetobacter sp. ANC 4641]